MAGALQDLMPHRMIDVILSLAGIERDLTVSDLKKAQRIALVKTKCLMSMHLLAATICRLLSPQGIWRRFPQ